MRHEYDGGHPLFLLFCSKEPGTRYPIRFAQV